MGSRVGIMRRWPAWAAWTALALFTGALLGAAPAVIQLAVATQQGSYHYCEARKPHGLLTYPEWQGPNWESSLWPIGVTCIYPPDSRVTIDVGTSRLVFAAGAAALGAGVLITTRRRASVR